MDILIKSLNNTDAHTFNESQEIAQLDTFIKEHATKYNLLSDVPEKDSEYISLTQAIINNRVRHQLESQDL